jgi:hypothetical protein
VGQAEERSPWRGVIKRLSFLAVVAGVGLVGARILDRYVNEDAPGASASPSSTAGDHPAAEPTESSPPPIPSAPRWLAVGGGVDPVSNQVSIEQNLRLVSEVLGPEHGVLLYGGGIGRSPVHELGDAVEPDLHRRLGTLFDPRDGRAARFRETRLRPHGPAEASEALELLTELVSRSDQTPLMWVVVAHGEPGETARHNRVPLWGGGSLEVAETARALDALPTPRPLRAVVTTCFSGGFGELAFRDADAAAGATSHDRCGLFAATWDTEASGCDPNPDRRAQEGYALHFFRALAGKDRDGKLDALIDLDRDGRISLLEAHSRARIASLAFSVPTSTSERWLAHAAPATGPTEPVELVEEDAVIEGLSTRLLLMGESAARASHGMHAANADALDERLAELETQSDAAYVSMRMAMLERWPGIDDPYHPSYPRMLDEAGAAIAQFLDEGERAKRYQEAVDRERPLRQELDELEVELALTERLVRAHVIRASAGRMKSKGGPDWDTYQRLLACERHVPVPAGPD